MTFFKIQKIVIELGPNNVLGTTKYLVSVVCALTLPKSINSFFVDVKDSYLIRLFVQKARAQR